MVGTHDPGARTWRWNLQITWKRVNGEMCGVILRNNLLQRRMLKEIGCRDHAAENRSLQFVHFIQTSQSLQ